MHNTPAEGDFLSQGDIFRARFVFPYTASLGEEYLLVREGEESPVGHKQVANAWANSAEEIALLPTLSYEHAIILSNSCDAESGPNGKTPLEFVLVGAVLPLDVLTEKNRDNCRHHKLIRYHYLAGHGPTEFKESFVHFGLVSQVRQEALLQAKKLRILNLSCPYREDLGHRFGEFISRVALP
jgi:hypothetical protein